MNQSSYIQTLVDIIANALGAIPSYAIAWVIFGIIAIFFLAQLHPRIENALKRTTSTHHAHLLARMIHFALLFIVCALIASNAFNINITSLLATAGLAGIAVAFAAQTSVANIISGLIILSENALQLGSKIETHGITGSIVAINLLSMLIQKDDESCVRISYKNLLDKPLTIIKQ